MAEKTIKAAVLGAAGRMGMRIIDRIAQAKGIVLAGAVERPGHPFLGQEVEAFTGIKGLKIVLQDDVRKILSGIDVVIDFTEIKSSLSNAEAVASEKKALVIGTTGFSTPEIEALKQKLRGTRCVLSPNMSIGVNVMFKIVRSIAQILKDDYDIEIVEAHHRMKKDAPSGTALRLGNIIADALERDFDKVGIFGRKGVVGERKTQEIGIHAVRAGDIVGDHTVLFAGVGERLEVIHRAHSRDTFAGGAVKAALWVVDQAPGIYSMEDVLDLHT